MLSNHVEDEFHFILVCPIYNGYRLPFLKKYYWEKSSMFKLLQLFHSENFTELCNLGIYVHTIFMYSLEIIHLYF